MKIATLVFSLFMAVSSTAIAQRQSIASTVAEQRLKSVVAIANTEPGKLEIWGAGTIIDGRGYILTCEHVVAGMKQVSVGFSDGQYLPASIVFKDASADVALLKVNGKRDFPSVPLSPADLKPGEPMIVIGSPVGLVFSVSAGVVSKIADVDYKGTAFKNAIQTDSSINPGNSGGPVFNADGELVGMAFLKRLQVDGIAWAINGDVIGLVLARNCSALKIAGVDHGISLDEELVGTTGAERRGVFVRFMQTPANAELVKGDRILKVSETRNDIIVQRTIGSRFDFERALWDKDPGDKVTLTVLRGTAQKEVVLTLSGSGVDRDEK
jgi:serine protease Do